VRLKGTRYPAPKTGQRSLATLPPLALYGGSFNYVHTGVSISDGGRYFKKAARPGWFDPKRPSALAMENPDPAFTDTDIGRNSFMMHKVGAALC